LKVGRRGFNAGRGIGCSLKVFAGHFGLVVQANFIRRVLAFRRRGK
jgi:hypothetical protein